MNTKLHYHYIYFNSCYLKRGRVNRNEYNSICLRDAENLDDVDVISTPLQQYPLVIRRLFALHTSKRVNEIIKLPLQNLWFPLFFKKKKVSKPYCFVIARQDIPMKYFAYLKRLYPQSKFVKIHRDLLKVAHSNPEYSEENMNRVFDLRYTFDEGEAKRYGLVHFDEIESRVDVPVSEEYPISDVFFAGRAKDRLKKILTAYRIFTNAGLHCDFYITDVPEEERIELPGITYADSFMPYDEMLFRTVNTQCLLDINQTGAVGYTSRILEAIIYNKRIIMDNPYILHSKYYNTNYIQFVANMDQIDPEFVKRTDPVNFAYEGDFSPVRLIRSIDNELVKKFGKPEGGNFNND